jgi:hypothetical protein
LPLGINFKKNILARLDGKSWIALEAVLKIRILVKLKTVGIL